MFTQFWNAISSSALLFISPFYFHLSDSLSLFISLFVLLFLTMVQSVGRKYNPAWSQKWDFLDYDATRDSLTCRDCKRAKAAGLQLQRSANNVVSSLFWASSWTDTVLAAGTRRQSASPCTPRAQAICRSGHMWLAWRKRTQFFTKSPRPIVLRSARSVSL